MLKAEPKVPGSLLGDVLIDSDGGSATIRVTVTVDSPNVPPSRRSPRVPLERGYYQGDRLATWWQRALAAVIDLVVYIPGLTLWSVGGSIQPNPPGLSDKESVGSWKAAVRDLAHILDVPTLYLLPIWDARRQTLADKTTRTVVISLKG